MEISVDQLVWEKCLDHRVWLNIMFNQVQRTDVLQYRTVPLHHEGVR